MDALSRLFFQPAGGMYREFQAVKAYVEATDLKLYRQLLPEPLGMPSVPIVILFVADFMKVISWAMPSYQEAAVAIRSSWRGQEGWYVLTMPANNRFATWTGGYIGFPMHLADDVTLSRDGENWCGAFRQGGTVRLALDFRAGWTAPLSAWQKDFLECTTFFHDEKHVLVAGRKPGVQKIHFDHVVQPQLAAVIGAVRVEVDRREPWAGLVPQDRAVAGAYGHFRGGWNVIAEPPG